MEARESALEYAHRQVQQLDQRIVALTAERDQILQYIQITQGEKLRDEDVALAASKIAIEKPQPLSARPGSLARQSNKQLVELSLEILRVKGEPMSAPEIHAVHPLREEFSPEMLYRLLYNRVVSQKLTTIHGAFWPIGVSLPFGWEAARTTSKRVKMAA